MHFKPGDTVRVIGSRGTAKIRAVLTDIHGALLEKNIDRFPRLEFGRATIGEAKQSEYEK